MQSSAMARVERRADIETFYYPIRQHSTLGNISPEAFDARSVL